MAASLVLFHPDGSVLLQQRAYFMKKGGGLLNVPGGYLEKDEDPFLGALREGQEETGYHLIDYYKSRRDEALIIPNADRSHYDVVIVVDKEWRWTNKKDWSYPTHANESSPHFTKNPSRAKWVSIDEIFSYDPPAARSDSGKLIKLWDCAVESIRKHISSRR